MSETSDLTVIVVGPLAQRAPLLATLERSGCRLEPNQGPRGHHHGFVDLRDDPTVGTIAFRCDSLDKAQKLAAQSGWALRLHYETPMCGVCHGRGTANAGTAGLGVCLHCDGSGVTNRPVPSPEQMLRGELDSLRAEIEALRGSR